ncbi:MAG TPA: ATP-binding protein [Thermomicrobiaceae bacterium]|nr:ATP-binding protein [Thermomicrobiaceae bacterium]
MTPRTSKVLRTALLVAVSLAAATAADLLLPGGYLVAALYAVPILIAARLATEREVLVTVGVAVVLIALDALSRQVPPVVLAADLVGLAFVGVLAVQLDRQRRQGIERRLAAERAERRATDILESITDGFLAFDQDWRFTYVNGRAEQFLGQSRDDLLGRTVSEALPYLQQLPSIERIREAMEQRTAAHFELTDPAVGRWFDLHAYPAADGLSVYFRDVTRRRTDEDARRGAEARYRNLVEQIPAVTYMTPLAAPGVPAGTGVPAYISPQIESVLGYAPGEWIGDASAWVTHIHPDDRERVLAANTRANQTGEPLAHEYRLLTRDGRVVWVRDQSVLVHDDLGQPRWWQGVAFDITERRRIEAERAEAARRVAFLAEAGRRLADVTPDYQATLRQLAELTVPVLADWCMVFLIEDGRQLRRAGVAHARPEDAPLARRLRGIPVAVIAPLLWSALRRGETVYLPGPTEVAEALASFPPQYAEVLRGLAAGSVVTVPLRARGRNLGVLVCIRRDDGPGYTRADCTFVEELARRCALVVDNARLYEEALQAARAREEFLATAAHELRTPLTAIKGYAQLLERRLGQNPLNPDQLRATIANVVSRVDRFEAILQDLLDVSRIEDERFEPRRERCDLVPVVRDTCDVLGRSAPAGRPIRLALPAAAVGHWDPGQLGQVVANLVSNALKYGGESAVAVSVRLERDDAVLEVSDRGPGMAAEERAHVFEAFYRAPSQAQRAPGTGLGLYITRRIVEQHGGTIGVASEPGAGTTFTVRLPLSPPDAVDPEPAAVGDTPAQ